MFTIIRQGDTDAYGVVSVVVDEVEDVETLPTTFAPGSTCFVIEDASTHMLSNKKEWKPI